MICDKSSEEVARAYRIGTTVNFSCNFDLARLVSPNKFDHFRNENFVYEMYLVDYNDDLIDIPILITNVRGSAGDEPNADSDESRWLLTRRFFMFDTMSGIQDGDFPDGIPTTV
jgi:hypothetical protein